MIFVYRFFFLFYVSFKIVLSRKCFIADITNKAFVAASITIKKSDVTEWCNDIRSTWWQQICLSSECHYITLLRLTFWSLYSRRRRLCLWFKVFLTRSTLTFLFPLVLPNFSSILKFFRLVRDFIYFFFPFKPFLFLGLERCILIKEFFFTCFTCPFKWWCVALTFFKEQTRFFSCLTRLLLCWNTFLQEYIVCWF